MKKIYKFLFGGIVMLFAGQASAQSTFTYSTAYDTITATPDTLRWAIPSPAQNAFGTATLKVYYQGDFGASVEWVDIVGESAYSIGKTQSYFDGSDCMEDSVTLTFPASLINTWAADDTLKFIGVTTNNVDLFCSANHVRLVLTYTYCVTGPVALITSAPSTTICSVDAAQTITFTPAGGTLSGAGVSGSSFDPDGLLPGVYPVTYTLTNGSGCTSQDNVQFIIGEGSQAYASDDTVCYGSSVTLTTTGSGHLVWYADAALNTVIGTGDTYVTPGLTTTTSFYSGATLIDDYFVVNSITVNDSLTVDHDALTGDDRGGIAVTNNYIYVVGDDNTARFDLNLGGGMSFPRMDGLFSDLGTGNLYTLYNPAYGVADANMVDSFSVTQFRRLNDDLTLDTGVVVLSDSIEFGWDSNYNFESGIYAGNGFVIIYSSPRNTWYAVDFRDGVVTNLGSWSVPEAYYSENWANWGVAEFDGQYYYALYRNDNNNDITRRNLSTGATSAAYTYSDVSDMASFTYAPWNNRIYMHYEGSGQFGGSSETLLYTAGNDSIGSTLLYGATVNCPARVTVTVDVCTDVKENSLAATSVYPNPNNGLFTLSLANLSDVNIEVYSVDGRLVYSEKVNGVVASKELDLTALSAGVYQVRVSNENAILSSKLIKN